MKQGTFAGSNGLSVTISGSTIYREAGGNQGATQALLVNGTEAQTSLITSTWFSLYSGDVVTLKLKNVSGKNNRTTGSLYGRVYINPNVVNSSATIALGETTGADKEKTVTLSSNMDVTCVNLTLNGPGEVTCDMELWVNGIRYL